MPKYVIKRKSDNQIFDRANSLSMALFMKAYYETIEKIECYIEEVLKDE